MNTLTILLYIISIAALVVGYKRGLIREGSSIAAVVLGIIACRLFGDIAAGIMAHIMGIDPQSSPFSIYAAKISGDIVLFIIVWVVVALLARMFSSAIKAIHLGFFDRLGGALFSMLKWLMAASLLLNLLYLLAPQAQMWGSNPPQGFIETVLSLAPWLFGVVIPSAT